MVSAKGISWDQIACQVGFWQISVLANVRAAANMLKNAVELTPSLPRKYQPPPARIEWHDHIETINLKKHCSYGPGHN